MLYSVAGSQGTGKSTLIDALQYPTITRKTSRSILADWGVTLSEVNNDRPLTVKFQEEILARKIEDEAAATQSADIYVTERTYADLFVYALVAIGKDNEYSDWLDEYYEKCRAAQSTYTHIFYLTAGHFRPVDDGVRAINQHYSWMVDRCMHEYTRRMSYRQNAGITHSTNIMTVVTSPDIDERVDQVKKVIGYR